MPPKLQIRGITKHYGATTALSAIALDVEDGAFLALLGPSGCGKSTLLRIIAGLLQADAGSVHLDGRDVTGTPAWERDIGLVFQNYALFPHMTVSQNVGFGLEMRRLGRAQVADRVAEALAMVAMDGFGARRPSELSGGQQQRVAIARAIAIRPKLLLLDEPLSNLDALLRGSVRSELRRLHDQTGLMTIMVTHDQSEALSLADSVAVMSQGRVEQHDHPEAIYTAPRSTFVAGFVGSPPANLIDLSSTRPNDWLPPLPPLPSGPITLAIRPEALQLVAPGIPGGLPARVEASEYMGAERLAHLRLADGQRVIARATGPLPPVGADIGLMPRAAQSAPSAQLFDRETGAWLADVPLPYNAEKEWNST